MFQKSINQRQKKELHYVVAVGLPEVEEKKLKELLAENEKVEGHFFPLEIARDRMEQIFEKLAVEQTLFITSDSKVLAMAQKEKNACLGFGEGEFLPVRWVVESLEEVDVSFLERVFRRYHQLPWEITETEHLRIREMSMEDFDALYELRRTCLPQQFLTPLLPYEQEWEQQKNYISCMYEFYGYGIWLVFEKETGELIGRAGFNHRDELGEEPELGYEIGIPWQNKGYATEAGRALLTYGREHLGFTGCSCLIEPENQISIKVCQHLGFHFEEDMEISGKEVQRYRLDEQEWNHSVWTCEE